MESILNLFGEHYNFWYILGLALIIAELFITGLAGPIIFLGIGGLFTGAVIHFGVDLQSLQQFLLFGISSAIITVLLWTPLKKYQNSSSRKNDSSVLVGKKFTLSTDITKENGYVNYSGVEDWPAKIHPEASSTLLAKGTQAVVKELDGNVILLEEIK